VPLSCLIGLPFGSVLQLSRQDQKLVQVALSEADMFEVCDLNSEMADCDVDSEWKDNRTRLVK